MIQVEEALESILAVTRPLPAETRGLLSASGMVLAEDVRAGENLPPFDRAAMDGYAVRARDVAEATTSSPCRLQVAGEVAAGYVFDGEVGPHEAVRIATGAPVPAGADAIIPFEKVEERAGAIVVAQPVVAGDNVSVTGEDVRAGDYVLAAGRVLGPAEIGLLAALGITRVAVTRRPRVALISTGDELVGLESPLVPGKIRNSNSYFLAALITECGGEPAVVESAPDRCEEISLRLQASRGADLIITTGGVSVGRYDLIEEALSRLGARTLFRQVAMKPGTPMLAALWEERLILALSGNPAAAYTAFQLFARPVLLKMAGHPAWELPRLRVTVQGGFARRSRLRRYLRAYVYREGGLYKARLLKGQKPGTMGSLPESNAMVVVPAGGGPLEVGDEAEAVILRGFAGLVGSGPPSPPVISVVGKSDSGKTTLIEKMISELNRRGYRVGTVKHDVHGFEMDQPGKDTWRHARAGAEAVVISSPSKVGMVRRVARELTLREAAAMVPGVDIIITEGYKRGDKPKIEVLRPDAGDPLCGPGDNLVALAADSPPADVPVPCFHRDDAAGICDLVERLFLQRGKARGEP